MKTINEHKKYLPAQQRYLSLPVLLSVMFLYSVLILYGVTQRTISFEWYFFLLLGSGGMIYSALIYRFILPSPARTHQLRWIVSIVSGIGIGLLALLLNDNLTILLYVLTILAAAITAITAGRVAANLTILIVAVLHLLRFDPPALLMSWITHLSPYLVAVILSETIVRLQDVGNRHIRRLETLNQFARQIGSSIETEQVIALLHVAIQQCLQADTYYVAFLKGDHFDLSLLYDDSQYYYNVQIPIKESLAGHVAATKQALFLADVKKEQSKFDFAYTTVGKDKLNRSWMGAPLLIRDTLIGVLAVASYKKNAFEEADFELLQNLTRQASIALDNSYRHSMVVQQSQRDSLTQAYNHGYFLEFLQTEADKTIQDQGGLSLIMLDVDQFKQYNDSYGHLVGDRVLIAMTASILKHIESTDAVGRWGGEEFAIMLHDADGFQARQVALRVRETLAALVIEDRDGQHIPAPTVSQGIAVFPDEANEIFRLIDLADQRLYIAKQHGRNQVEPDEKHWSYLRSSRRKI